MPSINELIILENDIHRILEIREEWILVINCQKNISIPYWISYNDIKGSTTVTEAELLNKTGVTIIETPTLAEEKISIQRYGIIAPLLSSLGEPAIRNNTIREIAATHKISTKTVKRFLSKYLIYGRKEALIPQPSSRKETDNAKHFRWALNKFYYTRNGKTLKESYTAMIAERFCDAEGKILPEHPSYKQFLYYNSTHRSLQTYFISRNGLKDYQMNHRPLVGENVQQFASSIGIGMLDATICDIYLVDNQGKVVGRPQLTVCVDAYSSLCCGYSLSWEGGMYSLRDMLLNCITDKVEWCKKFGIEIDPLQWNCSHLMNEFITDKGTEYASYNFEQITELGCKVTNLPAFRPELKGPVEKFFNLLQESYKSVLKGHGIIDTDYQQRGAHDYRLDATLTLLDFEKVIIHSIIYYNTQRIIKNFPYTNDMLAAKVPPHANDIWNYGVSRRGTNLIEVSKEKLVATLLPRTIGKFTRQGLVVNKLRYYADGFTESFLKGGSITVAYNPDDVSYVYLISDEYIKFNLIEKRFGSMALEDVIQRQTAQKELTKAYEDANLQARVDLANHIKTIAEQSKKGSNANIKDIRETRQRERIETHKNFIQEVTNEH